MVQAFVGLTPPTQTAEANKPLTGEQILPASKPFDTIVEDPEHEQMNTYLAAAVQKVTERYERAKMARRLQELIWLDAVRQWRGDYNPEELARIQKAQTRNIEASTAYIKITKTKAMAALGQIQEILFSTGIPIAIEAEDEPENLPEEAFIAPESLPDLGSPFGYIGDGQDIPKGATTTSLLGSFAERVKGLMQGKKVEVGPSPDPKQFPEINPADETAKRMQTTMLDQMEECGFKGEVRKAAWETVILGTGCIKGPLTYQKTLHNWELNQDKSLIYSPKVEDTPKADHVSIWNLYPDPNARKAGDAAYIIEKHLLNREQMAALKKYAGMSAAAIDRVLKKPPRRIQEYWEPQIRTTNPVLLDERYEVLEYWGTLEKEHIMNLPDVDKTQLATLADQAQVNIWICGNELLRVVINPFVPERIPYYIIPYEEHEYQIWGIGIPENMKDTQTLMNGHTRMMIDNLRLAGNVILEVNENQLVPGQDMALYPGKVFRKQGGAPGQSIYSIDIKSTAKDHMDAFDKARQLADEVTGQPSYSYGQSGISTTTRTAAGMSMLMGAAAGNIKQVVRNFDEFLFEPIGNAYFQWNLQFNPRSDIRGNLKVIAKGTSALMQKEVQSQRLLQFLQIISSNQLLLPFAQLEYILKQIAISMDLDPDKTVADIETAQLLAGIMAQMQQQNGGQQGNPANLPSPQGEEGKGNLNINDQTGGGGSQIGVGSAPKPGNDQFTGSSAGGGVQ